MWKKGNPCTLLVELWIEAATVGNSMEVYLKIELPHNPAILLLCIYPKKTKTLIQKHTCTPVFTAALFKIAKIWKQSKKLSTDEWIKKMWYIYVGRKWQPTPVFLPGKFHEQKSLTGYSPWGCKKLDITEHAHTSHAHNRELAPALKNSRRCSQRPQDSAWPASGLTPTLGPPGSWNQRLQQPGLPTSSLALALGLPRLKCHPPAK